MDTVDAADKPISTQKATLELEESLSVVYHVSVFVLSTSRQVCRAGMLRIVCIGYTFRQTHRRRRAE